MKSPWKMLGQLISRGRSPEPKQGAGGDTGKQASEQELPETPAPSSTTVLLPSELHSDEGQPVGEKSLDDARRTGDIAAAIPASGEQVEARSPKAARRRRVHGSSQAKGVEAINAAPRTKRAGQQKRASTDKVTQSTADANTREIPVLSHDRFYAEVADVDAEIGALSRQLAEKLIQQNAQLRKMLERFGVS